MRAREPGRKKEKGRAREKERSGRIEGDRIQGKAVRGGGDEIVRQGSSHEGRQTLVVNRAPRTAAVTRHCTPVFELHVFLSS